MKGFPFLEALSKAFLRDSILETLKKDPRNSVGNLEKMYGLKKRNSSRGRGSGIVIFNGKSLGTQKGNP